MPPEREQFLTADRVPNFDHAILATGDNTVSIRAEYNAVHRFRMAPERQQFLTADRVPNFDGGVRARNGDSLGVGAECQTGDTRIGPSNLRIVPVYWRCPTP